MNLSRAERSLQIHASCVAFDPGHGILIRGGAGSGKSSLALALMAIGGTLVSDDRTDVWLMDDHPWASAPPALFGLIEARGIGILKANSRQNAPIRLVIDLDVQESDRIPPQRVTNLLGHDVALLHKSESPCFAAAVRQYVIGGKANL